MEQQDGPDLSQDFSLWWVVVLSPNSVQWVVSLALSRNYNVCFISIHNPIFWWQCWCQMLSVFRSKVPRRLILRRICNVRILVCPIFPLGVGSLGSRFLELLDQWRNFVSKVWDRHSVYDAKAGKQVQLFATRRGFLLQTELIVWSSESNICCSNTCWRQSIFSLKNVHILILEEKATLCRSDSPTPRMALRLFALPWKTISLLKKQSQNSNLPWKVTYLPCSGICQLHCVMRTSIL